MLRLALRLLLAFLVLGAVGWFGYLSLFTEVVRVLAVGCLALGMLLLILDYLRTPDPSGP